MVRLALVACLRCPPPTFCRSGFRRKESPRQALRPRRIIPTKDTYENANNPHNRSPYLEAKTSIIFPKKTCAPLAPNTSRHFFLAQNIQNSTFEKNTETKKCTHEK
ncbi:MAG: hypothetical protein D6714_09670 [Bacteroidetes bacterium]|nr:MAG: hypothetical protein D6714_09670 [Bacteroidota bacterium]